MRTFVIAAAITSIWTGVSILNAPAATAQTKNQFISTGNYQLIDRQIAITSPLDVRVIAGRATTIDFTQSDEVIEHVLLADPSKTVYTPDAPIGSRQTKVIYLRPINPLNFPGSTRAYITNLQIRTIDSQKQTRNYVFNLVPSKQNTNYIGVRITNNPLLQPLTVSGRSVTADDLENGLQIAIQNGYTPASDPIVRKVQNLIDLVRSGTPIRAAAESSQVSIPIITALARMSYQEKRLPSPRRQSQIPHSRLFKQSPITVSLLSNSI
ncbi:hypothetical protein ACQ4M3_20550 [Leptolyngbya sp. AN03gr2]|uniref:hypothetical protein n=1 Tax=unclassified Leptolyngbya TaxID=2650499 RepID=UPI003D315AC1